MESFVRYFCALVPPVLVLWCLTIIMIEWGQIKTLEEKVSWLEEQVIEIKKGECQ